ncbi:27687_t:CDS:2, partial [Racocetra persica]
ECSSMVRTLAFQANDGGSIPLVRSNKVNLRIVLDDKKPLKAGDKLQGSYNGTEGQAFDEKEVQLEDIATVKSDDPWNKSGFLVIGSVRVKTDSNDDSAYSAIEEKVLLQEGSTNLLGYGVIGGM